MLFRLFLFSLLLIIQAAPAAAIVSIGQSIDDPEEDGLYHTFHLSFDGSQGNSRKQTVHGDLHSGWYHEDHAELLWLEHGYGTSNGITNTDRSFMHLRHRTRIDERWDWELFGQLGRDAFTRLQRRSLAGGGIRYGIAKDSGHRIAILGAGAFYEAESLAAQSGTTDSESKLWRGNLFLIFRQQLSNGIQLSSTTYYQPAISDTADFRLLEQFSLRTPITESMNLKLSADYTFDARPPQTVGKGDLRYRTGLEITF